MPSSKKRKAAQSDFKKSKSSLKAKQGAVPNNATNTSFRARSIVLPNQGSITKMAERKATKVIDQRGRGIEELILILKGVGPDSNKAEALDSLTDLLPQVEDAESQGLGLLPVLLPLLTSGSSNVRKSLFHCLTYVLSRPPRHTLTPYATTITVWVTSGMNHIFREVREDAAKVAKLVIGLLGDQLVKGWSLSSSPEQQQADHNGQRIFNTLLTALGIRYDFTVGSTSNQAIPTQSDLARSPVAKLRLLQCLRDLVAQQSGLARTTVAEEGSESSLSSSVWIFQSCLSHPGDQEAFENIFDPIPAPTVNVAAGEVAPFVAPLSRVERRKGVPHFADVENSAGYSLTDADIMRTLTACAQGIFGMGEDNFLPYRRIKSNPYLELYECSHQLLLHTYLDQAPSMFGPEATALKVTQDVPTGLKLIQAVMNVLHTLFRSGLDEATRTEWTRVPEAVKKLDIFLGHSSVYFPIAGDILVNQSHIKTSIFRSLNATWCELVGISSIYHGTACQNDESSGSKKGGAGHLDSVEDYLVELLSPSTDVTTTSHVAVPSGSIASSSISAQLSESEYTSLLPTIWHLISRETRTNQMAQGVSTDASLLSAMLNHWLEAKPVGPIKRRGFLFLAQMCTLAHFRPLSPQIKALLAHPRSAVLLELREKFVVAGLGKWLFELASSKTTGSSPRDTINQVLHFLHDSIRCKSLLLDETTMDKLLPCLQPLFWIHHPSRGELPGPWKKFRADRELNDIMYAILVRLQELARPRNHVNLDNEIVRPFFEACKKAGLRMPEDCAFA